MRSRIRVFTDFSLVGPHDTVHMLEPLSEAVRQNKSREAWRQSVTRGYEQLGPRLYELADSPDDADLAVLPFAWEQTDDRLKARQADDFARRAAAADKATLVFSHADREPTIKLPKAIVFRPSLRRSRRPATVVAMPSWVPDTLETIANAGLQVRPRVWRSAPRVGFDGNAYPLSRRPLRGGARVSADLKLWLRRGLTAAGLTDRLGISPTLHDRVAALRRLQRADGIETDFVIRSGGYFRSGDRFLKPGGVGDGDSDGDEEFDSTSYQREFLDNLLRTDYVLCVRGYGNYSNRMWEGMAAGCIPLFVDTDCVLPCEREVAWRELIVYVDSSRKAQIADVLRREHSRTTPEEFVERSDRCRAVWTERLSVPGFFSTIAQRLQRSVATSGGDVLGYAHVLEALCDPR